jgi:hypothetical protein
MSYHTSYAFAAPPDVVRSVMNDVDLVARWLGEELPLIHAPDGTLTARMPAGDGGEVLRYRIESGRTPLELSWIPVREPGGWPGRAIVRALPVGGSVIDIRLGVPTTFRTRINHIDRIVSHVLRRIDAEAERRHVNGAPEPADATARDPDGGRQRSANHG